MSLRLGFDLDGVLADLNGALVREARRLFPGVEVRAGLPVVDASPAEPPDPSDQDVAEATPDSLSLTSRQERQLWSEVKRIENFWETLDETEPGIIRRLAETAGERRWEVMFLTSRPSTAGDIVQVQSQRWLRRLGLSCRRCSSYRPREAESPARSNSMSSWTTGPRTVSTLPSIQRRAPS